MPYELQNTAVRNTERKAEGKTESGVNVSSIVVVVTQPAVSVLTEVSLLLFALAQRNLPMRRTEKHTQNRNRGT